MSDRGGPCAVCRNFTRVPATFSETVRQGTIRAGRILCGDCLQLPVMFVAGCLDCDWTHSVRVKEAERNAGRTGIQRDCNTHESHSKISGDTCEAYWREVPRVDGRIVEEKVAELDLEAPDE